MTNYLKQLDPNWHIKLLSIIYNIHQWFGLFKVLGTCKIFKIKDQQAISQPIIIDRAQPYENNPHK